MGGPAEKFKKRGAATPRLGHIIGRPDELLASDLPSSAQAAAACGTGSSVASRMPWLPAGFGAFALLDGPGSLSLGFGLRV